MSGFSRLSRPARIALVAGSVLAGLLGAAFAILSAWLELLFACFKTTPPANPAVLATCVAGFCASMAVPALAWPRLLPGARRAGLVTTVLLTVLMGGAGATIGIYLAVSRHSFRC
ncbi:hypothetical protein BJY16_006451 [Actinoplanes octamycinicus]|uniref:Uncharacterized protein n=1 Tax=Actinoplanes octamycinicus TaxID=135948 RepID=A0A7W7H324_9ACTN|nr:hypothetical protein [Actinoplanes octamycinicus]MBB4742992.1 hypothetical protein [Actinoplanes octamycinicus]GIE58154.1 hypothetical protein Aoc01nite_35560 [Actinoplanes octamycinicus]